MRPYPFYWIDVFGEGPLSGNPCAVVLDADDLDDERRLAVAREMNLSETSFVCASATADFAARYFTPAEEIPLAGHPTLATIRALIAAGRVSLTPPRQRLSLELKAGIVEVEVRSSDEGVEAITMSQLKPRFLSAYRPEDVAPVFGLTAADLLRDAPVQTVSTGTPQLMVPVRDLPALRRARLDVDAYLRLKARSDFFSPHLFCLEGATPGGRTFARHFGAPPDTLEDPFTGSATGGMGAYLWRHGLIDAPLFVAEQGHWMGRPGRAHVEIVGPRQGIETVRVGGGTSVIVRGEVAL